MIYLIYVEILQMTDLICLIKVYILIGHMIKMFCTIHMFCIV